MSQDTFTFFNDEDLSDIFQELEEANKDVVSQEEDDAEMAASQERYNNIIKKFGV